MIAVDPGAIQAQIRALLGARPHALLARCACPSWCLRMTMREPLARHE